MTPKLFWSIFRVILVLVTGFGLALIWDVSGWVIASGYLLGSSHMHMAHMAEKELSE